MSTTTTPQAERDAALAVLEATREAERAAAALHRAATDQWFAVTCGHSSREPESWGAWCTEAIGHAGDLHRNLHGATWTAGEPRP